MKVRLLLLATIGVFVLMSIPFRTVLADSPAPLFVSYPPTAKSLQDYVTTDKPYYVLGPVESAVVHISGHVLTQQPRVTITVKTPFGGSYSQSWNTDPSGYFAIPYLIGFAAPGGTYGVTVSYNGGQVSASFNVMRS